MVDSDSFPWIWNHIELGENNYKFLKKETYTYYELNMKFLRTREVYVIHPVFRKEITEEMLYWGEYWGPPHLYYWYSSPSLTRLSPNETICVIWNVLSPYSYSLYQDSIFPSSPISNDISHIKYFLSFPHLILLLSLPHHGWASLVAQLVKNPPAMQETWVWSLGWEDPLEKGKATHSSILSWRIQRHSNAIIFIRVKVQGLVWLA